MLLGEPERTQADLNFVLFGFPVRVHPFFWLVALLLGIRSSTPADVLIWVVAIFLSILIHELGHAAVIRAYGFHPWITLYGLGGLASYNQGQAYGSRGHGSLAQVFISLAGPGAQFVLAAVLVGAIKLSGHRIAFFLGGEHPLQIAMDEIGSPYLTDFLFRIVVVSIFWGVLNLMPVYPLDGGQVARELLLVANPRDGIRQSLWLSIFTGAALAVIGLLLWHTVFMGILFGYLAFMSYTALRAYNGQGPGW